LLPFASDPKSEQALRALQKTAVAAPDRVGAKKKPGILNQALKITAF